MMTPTQQVLCCVTALAMTACSHHELTVTSPDRANVAKAMRMKSLDLNYRFLVDGVAGHIVWQTPDLNPRFRPELRWSDDGRYLIVLDASRQSPLKTNVFCSVGGENPVYVIIDVRDARIHSNDRCDTNSLALPEVVTPHSGDEHTAQPADGMGTDHVRR